MQGEPIYYNMKQSYLKYLHIHFAQSLCIYSDIFSHLQFNLILRLLLVYDSSMSISAGIKIDFENNYYNINTIFTNDDRRIKGMSSTTSRSSSDLRVHVCIHLYLHLNFTDKYLSYINTKLFTRLFE